MKNLEVLGLSHNLLTTDTTTTTIPPTTLGKIMRLEELDLEHNQLGPEFPSPWFEAFPNLRTILLSGNTSLAGVEEGVLWGGYPKLQRLRLGQRAKWRSSSSSSSTCGGKDYASSLVGEYYIAPENVMGEVLHRMIKKRKLHAANYHIVREA